ncbi:hypothetical protein EKO27_g11393 [Xylaria grammica]|uniref:HNH nuclease domain-containing protein n=1 Tax=Xylaria grammica TaxID=363999 RepID=A0A439CNH2_9PEZI|nr:hypothetical protein EKO27_g11393 [Xylaria grammica]
MAAVRLQAPRTTDLTATAPDFISFLHPAESARYDVLFELPCLDSPALSPDGAQQPEQGREQQRRGLHHETALLACQIVANNAFDGYLSLDAQGDDPVPRSTVLLTAAEYYFIVPGDPAYAIVPAFQDWEFPHGRIPDSFPSPNASISPLQDGIGGYPQASRHVRCAVTGSAYSCQQAHLVPEAHEAWFTRNAMVRALDRGDRIRGIDGSGNLCPLRFDIRHALDQCVFALVYKASAWVVHVLQASVDAAWDEFAREYHNVQVRPRHLAHLSRECLFARFALSVFVLVKPFLLTAPFKRRVARLVIDAERNRFVTEISDLSSRELREEYGGGMPRRSSPTMRKRTADESITPPTWEAVADPSSPRFSDGDGRNSEPDTWYRDNVVATREEEERGRGRKRVRVAID